MNKQKIFDKVARGILAQGGGSYVRSYNTVLACRYRNEENGRKCAAGFLIPDALYSPHFENMTFGSAADEREGLRSLGDPDFIFQLQQAHDYSITRDGVNPTTDEKFLQRWRTRMIEIACKHGLDASVLVTPAARFTALTPDDSSRAPNFPKDRPAKP